MPAEDTERARRPLLLGHRGCRRAVPENTFAAFDKALVDGCDGFEFDVRRTFDARNIICHDAKLNGLDVATESFERLSETLSNPRRKLFGAPSLPTALPCLDEVIARYANRAFLDVELKTTGLEETTIELLRSADRTRVVVSSFLPEVVERVHALDATLAVGLIFDTRRTMDRWKSLPITHVMPHHALITTSLIQQWKDAVKTIIAWTVNDVREMSRLAALEVDGLISDDTELLSRTFRRLR